MATRHLMQAVNRQIERAELAARLVDADEDQRSALLQTYRASFDTQLAYCLKDICLDGWSSDPMRSLTASATLREISRTSKHSEITRNFALDTRHRSLNHR